MFKYLLPLVLAVTYSCASTSAEWSAWKVSTRPQKEQTWRPCSATLDGPQYFRKGWCWKAAECRTKNPWYSGEKKECRPLQLFCKHGDEQCYDLHGLNNKVLTNEENLK